MTMSVQTVQPDPAGGHFDLKITGMTCAGCASRVERALKEVAGVRIADVNLATDRAAVVAAADGADLVAAVRDIGFGAELLTGAAEQEKAIAAADAAEARRESVMLSIGVVLTLPLVVQMVLQFAGMGPVLPDWAMLALATPVQFLVGARFYRAAWKALLDRAGNMDQLVALGTSAAYFYSLYVLLRPDAVGTHLYFEAAAVVITLVRLGKWLEARAKRSTAGAIRALVELRPDTARVVRDGAEMEIPAAAVVAGDLVIARPGDRLPVDGVIREGASQLDESLLTGESLPQERGPGDRVIAGSINGAGLLKFAATEVGADTTLARIIAMVEGAQARKAPVQRLVDRVSAVFVPAVLVIAMITLGGWLTTGAGLEQALIAAVAVLVIACPCALGLATPAAIMAGTGVAARAGILIRDPEALERAVGLDTVVLDKTGTLTEGRPAVTDVVTPDGDDEALVRLAAAAQQGSEHPLARAVIARAGQAALAPLASFRALPGFGIEAEVAGRALVIGNRRLMAERGIDRDAFAARSDALEGAGRTVMWVAEAAGQALGLIAVADPVRPGAAEAVRRLRGLGLEPMLLTGDNLRAAQAVAAGLGIERVRAEVLPADKAAEVADLKAAGRRVGMVGDGVNDAPALVEADIGLAVASGTDVAVETAGITLMRGDPRLIPAAIEVARATYSKIRQNLFWAFIYNVIGLPLAAFGLLNPVFAGAAMALSSVSVISNALLLTRWRATEEDAR